MGGDMTPSFPPVSTPLLLQDVRMDKIRRVLMIYNILRYNYRNKLDPANTGT